MGNTPSFLFCFFCFVLGQSRLAIEVEGYSMLEVKSDGIDLTLTIGPHGRFGKPIYSGQKISYPLIGTNW